jgi:tetratricopeptide (TPR) repeat protein
MKRLYYYTALALFFLINSCSKQPNDAVVQAADYEKYFTSGHYSGLKTEIEKDLLFWKERLAKDTGDLSAKIKIAGLYSRRFQYSGNINDIHQSDSLYNISNTIQKKFSSSVYRSLAANAVTQHRFRLAQSYLDSALRMGDDKYLSLLQQFDVALELGNNLLAHEVLNSIKNKNSFEYLIREAKWLDHHKGDLNAAIRSMEKALEQIKHGGNKSLLSWAMANLADMYGHANRYEDSYKTYLSVLEKDHAYYHAWKGIAWLAFSHERNYNEAKRILNYLRGQHHIPDYELLLAEIAGAEKDEELKNTYLKSFTAKVSGNSYGDMYNKYLVDIYAGEWNEYDRALEIALTEVKNRPTAESYTLLSLAYYKKGDQQKAFDIAKQYIENRTFEPGALYLLGILYFANGDTPMAKKYFKECSNSSFELGPAVSQEISKYISRS